VDPECVRVSLIEGDVLFDMERYDEAIACYRRVSAQDPDYVPETVARLEACYEAKADLAGLAGELDRLRRDYPGMTVTLAAVRLAELKEGAASAAKMLSDVLRQRPNLRGATELLALEHRSAVLPKNELIENVMGELGRDRPSYRCRSCGFPAKLLHWQCPGCKRWNTVRRIQGVEGE
jgi:lipopolysaccharide biosynthesis regulator YciM